MLTIISVDLCLLILKSLFARVILRKQIHKKTIVHDGKEETVVTEDTQIEQDPNAPIELTESVQELIHQFLDSNGEPGSADSGAPD